MQSLNQIIIDSTSNLPILLEQQKYAQYQVCTNINFQNFLGLNSQIWMVEAVGMSKF